MPEIPMMTVDVRRPIEEVFGFVMDIEQTPRWRPRMSEVRWMTDDTPAVGSRFGVTVKSLGLTFHFDPVITVWDAPHRVSYRQETGPVLTDSHMEWVTEDGATRFRMGGVPQANTWWMRTAERRFYGPLLKANYFDLIRLKAILESDRQN